MKYFKKINSIVVSLLILLSIAACSNPASNSTPPAVKVTVTPTTPIGPAAPLVQTAMVQTKSGLKTVLTNTQGMPLYYFTPDTTTTSACTTTCIQTWQPLIMSSDSGEPTAVGSLTGQLTVVTTANRMQVAYNGHLLYTFNNDKTAGTADGDGLLGKWHVATPDLKCPSFNTLSGTCTSR
jgi:predicted lipoprotein with Yx(FWY)xxD motif